MQSLFERMPMEADIIVTIAVMLISGFAMTRVTKKLKLPNVTAYIVAGILIGPYVFKLVSMNVIARNELFVGYCACLYCL